MNEKYNKELISGLSETKILTQKDIESLNGSMESIKHSMLHSQIFRTETEAIVSVLQDLKHPTPDSKYWQSQRELKVQADQLFQLNFDYKLKQLDVEELQDKQSKLEKDSIEFKRNDIEIQKAKYALIQMELTAKDRIREVNMWTKITKELEPKMIASKNDVNAHQLLSYALRFSSEMSANIKSGAHFSPSESRNAVGLLQTTLKQVQEKGLMLEFAKLASEDVKGFLLKNNILQIEKK